MSDAAQAPEHTAPAEGACSPERLEYYKSAHPSVILLKQSKEYFRRTLECFTDADSTYRPDPNMLTVAGHVVHVAISFEIVLGSLFGAYDGFSVGSRRAGMFFQAQSMQGAGRVDPLPGKDGKPRTDRLGLAWQSLEKALALFDEVIDAGIERFGALSVAETQTRRMPANPLIPAHFTYADALNVTLDHAAHHRGALSQYARMLGRDPKLPYLDIPDSFTEKPFMPKTPTA